MNMRAGIAVVIIAAIVLGVYFLLPREVESPADTQEPIQAGEQQENYNLVRTFEEGVHTISGTITLPTPCHEIREDVVVAESFPEQVSIRLDVVDTGGICIQVIDERDFSIDVEVDEAATFSLAINGTNIVVPALAQ